MAEGLSKEALQRWEEVLFLQTSFVKFNDFLDVVMDHLHFDCTDIQYDIGETLQYGPRYLMIQAQRGQAKTTITAAFGLWTLIFNPSARVLIVSAGGKAASDTATLMIRLIQNMPILKCLRPDVSLGDRTSVEGFDVHRDLKGTDKSASVACVGVTGTITGKRADLLIADDIESSNNSQSQTMRAVLLQRTREFSSLCTDGRIIYLGTPQSIDSVYNTLPSRNFKVFIWPGRYPTPDQLSNYGDKLAPLIEQRILNNPSLQTGGGGAGDQGQPTDPRLDEQTQQDKESDQGTANYQLQYMLNTTLSDKDRYPLKTAQLVTIKDPGKMFPMQVSRDPRENHYRDFSVNDFTFRMAGALLGNEFAPLQSKIMYIDPAGGGANGDETAYAVVGFLNGNIFVIDCSGFKGGYGVAEMEQLSELAKFHQVNEVVIEKNYGNGAFMNTFVPICTAIYKCSIRDDTVRGQKEKRIAGILGPMIGRGSVVMLEEVVEKDQTTTVKYAIKDRETYSLFFQLSRMTLDSGSLIHDDRLDALASACNVYVQAIAIDQNKVINKQKELEYKKWVDNPLGYSNNNRPAKKGSVFNKYRR